jgi:hypothetical protein
MANSPLALGDLINIMFGKNVMTPGASSTTASGPFVQYGVMPPAYTVPTPMPANAVGPSASLSDLFQDYGQDAPSGASPSVSATPPSGPLSALFPNGETPTQQDALSPGMTKGLNAALPLLLATGLVAANSFGTGQPPAMPGRPGGTMQFLRPSDAFAKLMMAQQQRRR